MNSQSQLGEILRRHGVISKAQLQEALDYQKRMECRLGDALEKLGFCTEVEIARALSEQMEIPFVDLVETPPQGRIVRLVEREQAQELRIVPVRMEGDRLLIAAMNPLDFNLDAALQATTGLRLVVAAAPPGQIRDCLARYDQLRWIGDPRVQGVPSPTPPVVANRASQWAPTGKVGGGAAAPQSMLPDPRARGLDPLGRAPVAAPALDNPQAVRRVNALIAEAVRMRAQELTFEPREGGLEVRARVDGHHHDLEAVPLSLAEDVVRRLKVMAGVEMTRAGAEQGVVTARVDGAPVEFTVHVLPVLGGEMVQLRASGTLAKARELEDLGLQGEALIAFRRFTVERRGLLLLCGPLDSGITTTAYALLARLASAGNRVITVEAAVPRRVPGVTHTLAEARGGSPYAGAIANALEHRPDALYVDALPDVSSAGLALQAARQGILVVAGSRGASGLRAVSFLLDLGLDPAMVADGLAGIVSQRLVRRVCQDCAMPRELSFGLKKLLQEKLGNLERYGELRFQEGRGCDTCQYTGTRGRIAVFEVLPVDEDFRFLIAERAMPSRVEEHLSKSGHYTLEEDTLMKAGAGLVPGDDILSLRQTAAVEADRNEARARIAEVEAAAAMPRFDKETEEMELESWDALANVAAGLQFGASPA